jgi:hypothetical protein
MRKGWNLFSPHSDFHFLGIEPRHCVCKVERTRKFRLFTAEMGNTDGE